MAKPGPSSVNKSSKGYRITGVPPGTPGKSVGPMALPKNVGGGPSALKKALNKKPRGGTTGFAGTVR
jgi:hypothetical protein